MTEEKKGPAEVAAQVGTIEACWESYRDHVVLTTLALSGLPPDAAQYEHGCRLDFYAGAASVFQILRAMFEAGKPAGGQIMIDLETEVCVFLASMQVKDKT